MISRVNHHQVHKHIQNAFHSVEEGMKIYGTLRGAWELGKGIVAGARGAYQIAAPIAAALL